jgi:hypothetical protein
MFICILMLVIWFTLTLINTNSKKDVLDLVTNNYLFSTTDKFVGGTTSSDTLFKCINKLFIGFDTMDIRDLSIFSNK